MPKDLETIEVTLPGLRPDQRRYINKIIAWEKRNLKRGWPAVLKVLGDIARRRMAQERKKQAKTASRSRKKK